LRRSWMLSEVGIEGGAEGAGEAGDGF